jgi:hypothetical protein
MGAPALRKSPVSVIVVYHSCFLFLSFSTCDMLTLHRVDAQENLPPQGHRQSQLADAVQSPLACPVASHFLLAYLMASHVLSAMLLWTQAVPRRLLAVHSPLTCLMACHLLGAMLLSIQACVQFPAATSHGAMLRPPSSAHPERSFSCAALKFYFSPGPPPTYQWQDKNKSR